MHLSQIYMHGGLEKILRKIIFKPSSESIAYISGFVSQRTYGNA
jgi:hypothetical protein